VYRLYVQTFRVEGVDALHGLVVEVRTDDRERDWDELRAEAATRERGWRELIRLALLSGISTQLLTSSTGLTRQRLYQILDRRR